MADRGEHAPDLSVPSLKNGQFDFGLRFRRSYACLIRLRRVAKPSAPPGIFALSDYWPRLDNAQQMNIFCRLGWAIIQHNAARDASQGIGVGHSANHSPVGFWYMIFRVRQLKQKVAIVSQEDQAFRVGVESPHRTQHGATRQLD